MIFSSQYVNGEYKGNNYRNKGVSYYDIFDVEVKKQYLRPTITDQQDSKFNDERLVFVWKLYKEYMEKRFDIESVIDKIKKYNKMLSNKKNKEFYKVLYVMQAYISVFKLLHRKLIPSDYGLRILKHLKKTLFLVSKCIPAIDRDPIFKELGNNMIKELKKKNYHPVKVLHNNGIIFPSKYINFISLIPINDRMKVKC